MLIPNLPAPFRIALGILENFSPVRTAAQVAVGLVLHLLAGVLAHVGVEHRKTCLLEVSWMSEPA